MHRNNVIRITTLLISAFLPYWKLSVGQETQDSSCAADGTCGPEDRYENKAECEFWAKSCECQANPNFMLSECAKSCAAHSNLCVDTSGDCDESIGETGCSGQLRNECQLTCAHLEAARRKSAREDKGRCKRLTCPGGLQDRSMASMFTRIADEGWAAQHEPKVLSRDPWVMYFDSFFTTAQVDDLMKGMEEAGGQFKESTELSSSHKDARKRRTSDTMHCNQEQCFTDPRIVVAHEVITNITGLGRDCHELPQIVRYHPGQFYVRHQDTSDDYGRAAHGHRIYTLLVYFSDVTEGGGGETHLPALNLKVPPKKGAAVLWANVDPENPRNFDERSIHEGLPPTSITHSDGSTSEQVKIAGNFWLYGYDWRSQWHGGCMNVDAGF